jgi:hypothetical protein
LKAIKKRKGGFKMNIERRGTANRNMFLDLISAIEHQPQIGEVLHNSQVVFLPADDLELAKSNLELADMLKNQSQPVVILGASKSEGSEKYDNFVIKEPPIVI